MWILLLLRECENITDASVDALADKCRKLQSLYLR